MTNKDLYTKRQLKNLGNKLRMLRLEQGYSNYEQFAYEHNLPRAQYGRYEQGQDLRFSSLLKVLKALNVTPQDFFKKGFD
jgi:transcriptional regulator with XRE-family HTH domain